LNNAIETLHSSVPTEKWTYVNVMVAPSSITISDHEVLIVISIVCVAYCRTCCKLSTVINHCTKNICGGVECRTDSVPDFCGSALGAMEISVFWPKNLEELTDLEDSIIGGSRAHPLDLF